MKDETQPTHTDLWNELQQIKIKLIAIEESVDTWSKNLETIRLGFLEACEEFEASLQEDNNG